MKPTVVVASPRSDSRRRWVRLLAEDTHIRLLGQARSGSDALRSAGRRPRVLLLDGLLCDREGAMLVRSVHRRSPQTRILVVTRAGVNPLDVLSHGARGYLRPRDLPAFLTRAVRALHRDEAWVPRRMVSRVLGRLAKLSRPPAASRG